MVPRLASGLSLAAWTPAAPSSRLSRAPETWFRGEAEGVAHAPHAGDTQRGWIHDLGEGTYFADSRNVAEGYADLRAPENPAIQRVLSGKIDPKGLGARVLDLSEDTKFMEHFDRARKTMRMSGEPYWNMVEGHLRVMKLKIEDFDILIGPEGVSGGKQMCIRNPKILAQVRAVMAPIKPGAGGTEASGGGTPGPSEGLTVEPPVESAKPPTTTATEPPVGGRPPTATAGEPPAGRTRLRIGPGGRGRMSIGLAKMLGPMVLDMINRYYMAKAETQRAVATISATVASPEIEARIVDLVDRQRLDIARRQFRGGQVYVTVSMKLGGE
jgi:hypothetical protein